MKKLMIAAIMMLASVLISGEVFWAKKFDNPKNQQEFYINQGTVPLEKIKQPGRVKITIIASGDTKLGCRLRVVPQIGKKEFKPLFWNRTINSVPTE